MLHNAHCIHHGTCVVLYRKSCDYTSAAQEHHSDMICVCSESCSKIQNAFYERTNITDCAICRVGVCYVQLDPYAGLRAENAGRGAGGGGLLGTLWHCSSCLIVLLAYSQSLFHSVTGGERISPKNLYPGKSLANQY